MEELQDTRKKASQALGPVYVPGLTREQEGPIVAVPVEEVDPAVLGLPTGARIKPASQIFAKRILQTQPHRQPPVEPRVCNCAPTVQCPASQRDYITFRKSCPYGQVQCCTDKLFLGTSFEPVPLDIAATTTEATANRLNTLSKVRPVILPFNLVPKGTNEKTDFVITNNDNGIPTTTQRPTTREAVTPYTIVSSSMTVTKVVWESVPPAATGRQLGHDPGFLEKLGNAVIDAFTANWW